MVFFMYPIIFFLFTRKNPFIAMRNVIEAFVTALSTSSSAATFPVTYKCAVEKNDVPPTVAKFVLSLGMAKREAISYFEHLEHFVREDLNLEALRKMVVFNPLKIILLLEGYHTNDLLFLRIDLF